MATTKQPDQQPLWTVIGQQPSTVLDSTGQYVPGMNVTFRTRSGSTGQVGIPDTVYRLGPDHIQPLIHEAAMTHEAVAGMTGPTT